MTTNIRLLAMAALAMLAMNSCVKEENLNNGEKKGTPVEFEMGVNSVSRTETPDDGYTTTFVEGDEVGIFVYEGETPVVINAPYKLVAGGKWEAQGEVITAEEGKSYKYYAYYPYNAGATDATTISLTVASDQTNGYNTNDALIAKAENVTTATTTVELEYSHAFALVQVNLKGALVSKDATVTLQNIYPTANINLISGITTEDVSGRVATVAMKACSTNGESAPFSYRAIVPAQKIVVNNNILTVSSLGKNYKFSYNKDVPYESGKLRNFDVTIGPENGSIMEISEGTIANWENSAAIEEGNGSIGQVVEPTTSLDLSTLINTEINFVKKGIWSSDKVTGEDLIWYHRENTSGDLTAPSIETVEGISVIKLYNEKTKSSWNNSNIGCHFPGAFERTTYKVTITAQTDEVTFANNKTNGAIVGITISNSDDTKMFKIHNDKGEDWSRNVTTYNQLNNTTWTTRTFYIDLNYAYENGASKDLTDYSVTTDNEVARGINITLYNYTGTCPSSIYIKEVKIEKSELPKPTK